ncbi:cell division protein FtsQ/DivIB [Brevundimonas sp.]|jgi:cell division protein FtsQ|uniref:cell division protein FtsQ/DivIB n=1 Tax=Brevundimonas sp. TaxID=1871086 RepID=UPI0025BF6022|nr:cell division protein FtsQ/DivIB [Brevundimonas sp.]
MAAIGRLDLSPRAVVISIAAGGLLLAALLATGARAERIGASFSRGVDGVAVGLGLKLEKVFIEGESPEATRDIQRAVQLPAGQPMTSIDLDAVRERVEQVGWVRSARVVRLLPDTLIVDVTEHDRLAVWQTGGRAWVIDGQGQIIRGADPGRYPALPLVVGKGAEQAAAEILPLLAQRPRLQARMEALVRVDERRWDLRLKDGSLIQLPATDAEAALIQLDALDQRERLLELGFARIDLRTPDQVAVRPSAGDA